MFKKYTIIALGALIITNQASAMRSREDLLNNEQPSGQASTQVSMDIMHHYPREYGRYEDGPGPSRPAKPNTKLKAVFIGPVGHQLIDSRIVKAVYVVEEDADRAQAEVAALVKRVNQLETRQFIAVSLAVIVGASYGLGKIINFLY